MVVRVWIILLPLALAVPGRAGAQTAETGTPGQRAAQSKLDPARERMRILQSLATACRRFSDDAHWAELDACNRAWFRKNEEAVWRLKLNPHDRTTDVKPAS